MPKQQQSKRLFLMAWRILLRHMTELQQVPIYKRRNIMPTKQFEKGDIYAIIYSCHGLEFLEHFCN